MTLSFLLSFPFAPRAFRSKERIGTTLVFIAPFGHSPALGRSIAWGDSRRIARMGVQGEG